MADKGHPWNPPDEYIQPPPCPKVRIVRDLLGPSFPRIVCLCGSTRFMPAFRAAMLAETLADRIVLTVGSALRSDDELGLTRDAKQRLDELHLRKIDLADEVFVLNVGGYIGESTGNELAYALALAKPVRTLEYLDLEAWLAERMRQVNATAMRNVES
ncbi:MAG TPA: hypothetical protein VMY35_14845 [Phycisphaerae bacterium]|nr:hypothetical protein [Phycisphaerae bacterium]